MSYYDDYLKKTQQQKEKEIAVINDTAAKQKNSITENYGAQIADANIAYDDQHRVNEVQKLINERKIAESMANLGLTDSGLNRTQQTATQMSYANQKANIDRQRQSAVDALNREMNAYLTEIDVNTASSVSNVNKAYSDAAMQYQENMLAEEKKNAATIEAARIKAQQEAEKKASYIIQTNGGNLSKEYSGTLADNNVSVRFNSDGTTTYTDNNSGKSSTFESSINPYTGDNNAIGSSDTSKAYDKYSAFDNGYQPKGVYYNGKDYGYVSFSGYWDEIYGNMQRIHKTKDGSLWIWDGRKNKYIPYIDE